MPKAVLTLFFLAVAVSGGSVAAQTVQELGPAERQAMTDAVQYALENQATNQAAEWVNPDSQQSGAVIPTRAFQNEQGLPCREFITTIVVGGREEQGYGTACRQPDGAWRIQRRSASPSSAPAAVYLERPPERYYYYPPEVYGYPRIYLSFSFVYRSGQKYFGVSYLDGPAFRRQHPVWGRSWAPPPGWKDGRYGRHYYDRGKKRGRH